MTSNRFFSIKLGCLLVMLSNTNLVNADDTTSTAYQRPSTISVQLPPHYPSHFPKLGKLSEIRGSHDWVINGKAIKVSSNVIIHSLVTDFSSMYSIKQGMALAYRENKQGEVMEVWELPKDSFRGN